MIFLHHVDKNCTEKSNPKQQKRFQCSSINHLHVTSKDLPLGLAMQKENILALDMGISQAESKKIEEDAVVQ